MAIRAIQNLSTFWNKATKWEKILPGNWWITCCKYALRLEDKEEYDKSKIINQKNSFRYIGKCNRNLFSTPNRILDCSIYQCQNWSKKNYNCLLFQSAWSGKQNEVSEMQWFYLKYLDEDNFFRFLSEMR